MYQRKLVLNNSCSLAVLNVYRSAVKFEVGVYVTDMTAGICKYNCQTWHYPVQNVKEDVNRLHVVKVVILLMRLH